MRVNPPSRFAVLSWGLYDPAMTYPEGTHETDVPRQRRRVHSGIRRVLLIAFLTFIAWLLLANHLILVGEEPAFIVLKKTSWTFDGCAVSYTHLTLPTN